MCNYVQLCLSKFFWWGGVFVCAFWGDDVRFCPEQQTKKNQNCILCNNKGWLRKSHQHSITRAHYWQYTTYFITLLFH